MARPALNRDTTVCISLSGRPSNHGIKFHNYLYEKHGLDYLYKAMTTTDIEGAYRRRARAGYSRLLGVYAVQAGCYPADGRHGPLGCGHWCGEHDCEH